jgi:ubiquinone/menaquinone biosynthesis C-methylase UbiE
MIEEEIARIIMQNAVKGSKILEIGFGTGSISLKLAKKGYIIHGIDSSKYAITSSRAQARLEGLSDKVFFNTSKAESLDFPNKFFDLIYLVKTLHETKAVEALREMHRVLKKGGKILIIDWIQGAKTWIHEQYFKPEKLEEMITQEGFKRIQLEVIGEQMLLIAKKV